MTWRISDLRTALLPHEPLTHIVNPVIETCSLSILYGAPGTMKSLLLADLCACVAAGKPWLSTDDSPGFSTVQTPVLFVDVDNGKRRSAERFAAIARGHSIPDSTPFFWTSFPMPWFHAGDTEEIEQAIKNTGAGLVIVDNLGVTIGDADENSASMASVMSGFRCLVESTGVACTLVHHQRKSSGVSTRAGETLRGHSSIEAAIDLALLVERDEHADLVSIKSTKSRGADVLPFGARFDFTHKPDSNELETARFYGVPIMDTVSDNAIEKTILAIVKEQSLISKGKLSELSKSKLDAGINRIRSMIDKLEATKKIVVSTGNRGAKLYELPK